MLNEKLSAYGGKNTRQASRRNSAFFVPRFFGHKRDGFGLIETVVGAAIISMVLFGLSQIGQLTFRLTDEANFKIRASYLAEEGLEIVRIKRDSGWSGNIAPLILDADYFFTFVGGQWQLGLTPVLPVDNVFARRVRFSAVYRDADDAIIASGGTLDPNAKKVTAEVWWSNRANTSTTSISTYLTNLFNN